MSTLQHYFIFYITVCLVESSVREFLFYKISQIPNTDVLDVSLHGELSSSMACVIEAMGKHMLRTVRCSLHDDRKRTRTILWAIKGKNEEHNIKASLV